MEENQFEQLKILLEQNNFNVNALNSDGFSVLDLAVLLNNRPMTKLLLQHKAQSANFPSENIENHLAALLSDSEKKLSQINSSSSTSSSSVGLETEKIIVEKRIKLIRKMVNGYQKLRKPDAPFSFTIGMFTQIKKKKHFFLRQLRGLFESLVLRLCKKKYFL